MAKSRLKYTGFTHIPDNYNGEPCTLSIQAVDKKNVIKETEIHFDNGLTGDILLKELKKFLNIDDFEPIVIEIKSFNYKK